MLLPAWAPTPVHAQSANKTPARSPITVDFVDTDIELVARAFSAMLRRPILLDPRVKGSITVYSERPQSIARAYMNFLNALRGQGYNMVQSDGVLRVVPEAEARLRTDAVSVGQVAGRGDEVITQIFPLRFENANNLVALLRPLISPNNVINIAPGSNSLVITDHANNLQRLAKIIASIDRPSGTGVEIVPLRHGIASEVAPLVLRLVEGGSGAGAGAGGGNTAPGAGGNATTVVPDPRSNGLIVRAPNASRMVEIRAAIAQLDKPNTLIGPGGGMWVVNLKNADAARLAVVIRAAFAPLSAGGAGASMSGLAGSTQPVLDTSPGGQAAQGPATRPAATLAPPSTGGFIQADTATNSLIITAPEPLYKQVRQLIDRLDERRAQVYIESMIVEVSPSDSADFGFQWQGLLGKSGDKLGLVAGTNFNANGRPSIIDINTAAAEGRVNVGAGLNLGLLSVVNGFTSLAAIAKLLQTQSETNIISTPNLITLDNEEAKIVVGENVPFITGQFTSTGGGGNPAANPFQTIERKDVGITLRIKPQVGEGGAVRMTIFQEQSSVKETTAAGTTNAGPSTTKRSIENTVVVDDGAILVLGGLIEDRFVTTKSKVPLLGDMPLVGGLFRSESRERRRTNLMVFLRPVVLRDAVGANRLSSDRYDRMRGEQQSAQPERSFVMPINQSPVLPPLQPSQDRQGAPQPAAKRSESAPLRPQPRPAPVLLGDPAFTSPG